MYKGLFEVESYDFLRKMFILMAFFLSYLAVNAYLCDSKTAYL